jgi:hypothetical protein
MAVFPRVELEELIGFYEGGSGGFGELRARAALATAG